MGEKGRKGWAGRAPTGRDGCEWEGPAEGASQSGAPNVDLADDLFEVYEGVHHVTSASLSPDALCIHGAFSVWCCMHDIGCMTVHGYMCMYM